jgi:uncharacterized protein YjiS (DUF1127 family)
MDGHFHVPDQAFPQARYCSGPVQRRRPVLVQVVDLVMGAVERARGRRVLSLLDDRMLRDIGIDRGVANYEGDKPFWR